MATLEEINQIAETAFNKMLLARGADAKKAELNAGVQKLEQLGFQTGNARIRQKKLKRELKFAILDISRSKLSDAVSKLTGALSELGVSVDAANQVADNMPLRRLANEAGEIADVVIALDSLKNRLESLPTEAEPDFEEISNLVRSAMLELEELLDE